MNFVESLIKLLKMPLDIIYSQLKHCLYFGKKNGYISLAFRFAIPKGFYGNIFPQSGLFKDHLITCDAGVLDLDFRGIVQVLMINHHPEKTFTIRTGDM